MSKRSHELTSLKWIATLFGVVGAILVALNNGHQFLGFVFFTISSSSWVYLGAKMKENSLVLLNIVFTVIDIIGLFSYAP